MLVFIIIMFLFAGLCLFMAIKTIKHRKKNPELFGGDIYGIQEFSQKVMKKELEVGSNSPTVEQRVHTVTDTRKAINDEQYRVDVAYYAFKKFRFDEGDSTPPQYKRDVDALLAQHETALNLYKAIAEYCGNAKSPKALYTKATAYMSAGSSCRRELIEALNEYLESDMFSALPDDIIEYRGGVKVRRSDAYRASLYICLGEAYSGEYDFENAMASFRKSHEIDPTDNVAVFHIADTYRKMNNLDTAIHVLEDAIKNAKPSSDAKRSLNERLNEYKDKKAKGYVYRPRKKADA